MAYNALNNLIDAYIYPNGVQAITGSILNNVLKAMVSQLGGGYNLMGVAAPASSPAVNDEPLAYFAATAGTYTNFDGIVLAAGEVAVLLTSGNGSWSKQTIYNIPTGTADLANTAGFITSAVNSLVNYYTKTEIDTALAGYTTTAALATALADYYNKASIDAQMATRYTKSEVDTKLGEYYKKTETYDKDEVDSIVAALSRQEYVVAWDGSSAPVVADIPAGVTVTYSGTTYTGTMDASASTVNKIYMVWNGTAYDMYGTSQDGGFSWVPMGTTTVDLSQYATKSEVSQLEAKLIEIFAFATSKPAGIGDGEVYYHTTDKLLYQAHTGSSSTVVPFYDGAIYTYNNKLYIWDGTNLIPVAEEIKKDKVWSFYFKGEGAVSSKSTIQLIENHLYRFSFPIKWAHTTIVNNIIGIYDGSDTLVWGLASNLEIPNDVLIRANQYPLYDVYLRADSGVVGYVVVEDITETYTINEENKDDITYMYAIGSIKNNANIGSVCPMEEDADTAWRKLVLPVKEGQFFVFNIQGASNYLPAVFVDDNNIVIDKTSSNAVRQLMVVPKGATKLVSTFSPSRAGYVYRYGCYDRLEKHSSLSKVASLFGKELKEKTLLGSIVNNAEIGSKPTLEVDTTDPKWRYIELDVISGERFTITGRAGNGARLWAILDSTGYLLSISPANANVQDEEIIIPLSGAKLICNFWIYSGTTNYAYSLVGGINDPFIKNSPYYKNINFGVVPTDDYVGSGSDYSWGSSSVTTNEVYDKFDSFINTSADISDRNTDVNDGYIYRQKIGNASDGQPLVMYEFKPNIAYGNNNPKIFAICGQHGFEKQSTFGMWYLLNDVVNNTRNSPVAKYIREFVHLYIVPVANPSGWDINNYVNSNGVNLNRNWYVNGWTKVTSPASEVTGDEPFDQPETAAMRDAIDGIGSVFLLMDCHQNGSGVVTTDNINWLDITKVNDDYYNETLNASTYEISAITRLFRNLYQEEIGGTNALCGRIGNPLPSGKGYADLWAVEQRNIIGITHEGFGGFPLGIANNANSHKANSELLGNYIKNFLGYYCRI